VPRVFTLGRRLARAGASIYPLTRPVMAQHPAACLGVTTRVMTGACAAWPAERCCVWPRRV